MRNHTKPYKSKLLQQYKLQTIVIHNTIFYLDIFSYDARIEYSLNLLETNSAIDLDLQAAVSISYRTPTHPLDSSCFEQAVESYREVGVDGAKVERVVVGSLHLLNFLPPRFTR